MFYKHTNVLLYANNNKMILKLRFVYFSCLHGNSAGKKNQGGKKEWRNCFPLVKAFIPSHDFISKRWLQSNRYNVWDIFHWQRFFSGFGKCIEHITAVSTIFSGEAKKASTTRVMEMVNRDPNSLNEYLQVRAKVSFVLLILIRVVLYLFVTWSRLFLAIFFCQVFF